MVSDTTAWYWEVQRYILLRAGKDPTILCMALRVRYKYSALCQYMYRKTTNQNITHTNNNTFTYCANLEYYQYLAFSRKRNISIFENRCSILGLRLNNQQT